METYFDVSHLSVERLLANWRWLCPQPLILVARDAFGNLFLKDEHGTIRKLDICVGKITRIAESEAQFRQSASSAEKRQEWFAEDDVRAAEEHGLIPNESQCVAFKIPVVFKESKGPDNVYLADLYEQVAFLGDLNRQIAGLPDGSTVHLTVADKESER